jgi:hypothetical protein
MSYIDPKIGSFIEFSDQGVKNSIVVGNIENSETKELNAVFKSISDIAFFDTGILPLDGSGTLMIRQALGHSQVVFQHAPGICRVIWGGSEGDSEAVHYDLAMPYRIVIGDFVDNEFYGARHFYSPSPITSLDQALFHVNLPNLNCKGYGNGNGVGWICLYHNKPSISHLNLGQKIANLIERTGGTEAYNDANMNETDGPRFYAEMYENNPEYRYLWDPELWEHKSSEEGSSWTLDGSLWIPVIVQNMDNQTKHYDGEDGSYYTLRMAVDGKYRAYYSDPNTPKNYQKFIREDLELPDDKTVFVKIQSAFKKAENKILKETQTHQPIIPFSDKFINCKLCNEIHGSDHVVAFENGYACESCAEEKLVICVSCDTHKHYADMAFYNNNFHCSSCVTLFQCKKCYSFHENEHSIINNEMCTACSKVEQCSNCLIPRDIEDLMHIEHIDPYTKDSMSSKLCPYCVTEYIICECKTLVHKSDVYVLENNQSFKSVCKNCHDQLVLS